MRIVVTVDTEADGQWDHGRHLATANVAAWPPFQELCRRHAVRPTYLITSEIAEDLAAAAFLRPLAAAGAVEIGSHLHPWTTPPFGDAPGLRRNDPEHAYPCHLEPDLLRAKLETLTAQVAQVAGTAPSVYRAGRFGLDATGARLLAELGYLVDSSVTPFVTWTANAGRPGRGGGPDFRHHDAYPFRVAGTGTPGLVEMPVTIMPTYAVTRRLRWLREHWQARPIRRGRQALRVLPRPQPLWLRPRPEYTLGDLQAVLLEAERARLPFAVFMFHSSELLAGASPYRPAQADVDVLLSLLDRLFAWSRGRGYGCATLSEAGRELAAYDRLPTQAL
ncbi:MAG TPA: hypothetical protein VIL79_11350 [Thermoleophilia bacterium]